MRDGKLRLREREPTAAAADADQHSVPVFAPTARRTSHRAGARERTRSVPATAAADQSAWASALVLAETEQVPHRLSINPPVGCRGRLLEANGGQMQELVDDL